MYLKDVWSVCRRRWKLLLIGLVLAAGAIALAVPQLPRSYTAQSDAVLVPPKKTGGAGTSTVVVNPYLGLGGLDATVDVLERSMLSQKTTDRLAERVPGAAYVVAKDPTTSAPIIHVTATGTSPRATAQMLDAVLRQLPANLSSLQEELGIKPAFQITLIDISGDERPALDQKPRVRALAVLVLLLIGALAGVVALVDGLAARRGSSRVAGGGPSGTTPAAAPPAKRRPPGPPPKKQRRSLDLAPGSSRTSGDEAESGGEELGGRSA